MLRSFRLIALCLAPCLALAASACGRSDQGALAVAIVGEADDPFEDGVLLSVAGQHVRAATTEGLVGLDANGQVIPALADRWAFADDGRSYIFRLRDGSWADGSELTAESVAGALRRVLRRLAGTSLGYDLGQIAEIRAMAARVVEIRLKGPMPEFLQLFAQPELGLTRSGKGTGPMILTRAGNIAVLSMMAPEDRGLPAVEDWQQYVRELRVEGMSAERAIAMFDDGEVDVVLNGRIESLPLVHTGPLSSGTVRLDPASGLFGLLVRRAEGLLGDVAGREAVSMAIDREGLLSSFSVGGWEPTTRIVGPGLAGDLGTIGERWDGMSLANRRAAASAQISAWKSANPQKSAELTIALPDGPGGDILFRQLVRDLAEIGITLQRPQKDETADLELVDRVARYPNPSWFLNQFHCGLGRGLCSQEGDMLVSEAAASGDPAERARLLAEAEAELTGINSYIPFGSPVRWSLVRAGVAGYGINQWVFHPLPQLAAIPR